MNLLIVILRSIGLVAVLILIVLLATDSKNNEVMQVTGWTGIFAFGLSFILKMIKSLLPSRKSG